MNVEDISGAIGGRAREERTRQGLTLKDVAAAVRSLGVPMTYSMLAKFERGAQVWNLKSLLAVAHVLRVRPAELLLAPDEAALLRAHQESGVAGVLGWAMQRVPGEGGAL